MVGMNRILIAEDDKYLRRDLREILGKNGYETLTVSTVQEGMYYVLSREDIDLYLLDVWLPDGDGFELCRQIRQRSIKPVLFLTACDDERSVVKGLDMGADDYISKPFRSAELLSRIRANLRRQESFTEDRILICGDVVLNPGEGSVRMCGREISLRPVEYRLLLVLMRNGGRIVKRERLMEEMWDELDDSVEDNTLSVHISRLRRKLGAAYIETIRGFGYRFAGRVSERIGC